MLLVYTIGMSPKRSSIFLSAEDHAAIQTVCDLYGLSTESDALRLAVRILAASPKLTLPAGWQPQANWPRRQKTSK